MCLEEAYYCVYKTALAGSVSSACPPVSTVASATTRNKGQGTGANYPAIIPWPRHNVRPGLGQRVAFAAFQKTDPSMTSRGHEERGTQLPNST